MVCGDFSAVDPARTPWASPAGGGGFRVAIRAEGLSRFGLVDNPGLGVGWGGPKRVRAARNGAPPAVRGFLEGDPSRATSRLAQVPNS